MRILIGLMASFFVSIAHAGVILEYSEVGDDLVIEFSGTLGVTGGGTCCLASHTPSFGNQGSSLNPRPTFYSNNGGYGGIGNLNVTSVTSPTFWSVPYMGNVDGDTTGDTLLFRYNGSINTLNIWLSPYTAGDLLSGSATFENRSIASTGLIDWRVEFDTPNGTDFFEIRAAQVPEPFTLSLMALGLLGGIGMRRQRG